MKWSSAKVAKKYSRDEGRFPRRLLGEKVVDGVKASHIVWAHAKGRGFRVCSWRGLRRRTKIGENRGLLRLITVSVSGFYLICLRGKPDRIKGDSRSISKINRALSQLPNLHANIYLPSQGDITTLCQRRENFLVKELRFEGTSIEQNFYLEELLV